MKKIEARHVRTKQRRDIRVIPDWIREIPLEGEAGYKCIDEVQNVTPDMWEDLAYDLRNWREERARVWFNIKMLLVVATLAGFLSYNAFK